MLIKLQDILDLLRVESRTLRACYECQILFIFKPFEPHVDREAVESVHPFSDLSKLFQVALGTICLDELLIKGEIEGALVDLGYQLLHSCIDVNHLLLSLLRSFSFIFLLFHIFLSIFLIIIIVVVVLVLVILGGFPRSFHFLRVYICN